MKRSWSNKKYSYFTICILLILQHVYSNKIINGLEEQVKKSEFPNGFLFGTSTSAYQIEGAYIEDGKSLCNWDTYCRIDGRIPNGESGDIANDHYHRYLEDIDIMASLGVNAYRFSISWSRILPRGKLGPVNPTGIKFYNNIIDSLLLKGIIPFVTIHHYDYPQEFEDRFQAWLSPIMQEEFVHLAEICFKSFGDRVKYWVTINEPNLYMEMAYLKGVFPPSHCSPPFGKCSSGNSDIEPLLALHNSILAHAKAVKIYRDQFQAEQGGMIGMVASAYMIKPMTNDEADNKAANRALAFRVACDVLCTHGENRAIHGFVLLTGQKDGEYIGDQMGMPGMYVVPQGREEIVDYVNKRYNNIPIFVTENGYTSDENQEGYDMDQDMKRIKYHKAYLASLARSIRNGADVRGYFVWSLMDNFEWRFGYTLKFGLYHVHPVSLDRSPKLSAHWFRDFLTNSSLNNLQAKSSI